MKTAVTDTLRSGFVSANWVDHFLNRENSHYLKKHICKEGNMSQAVSRTATIQLITIFCQREWVNMPAHHSKATRLAKLMQT